MSCTNKKKILEIEELSVSFLQYEGKSSRQSWLPVISGLSVAVRKGELVAVVGSSGSGKSLLAHAIMGILPYNARVSGNIKFQGETLDESRIRKLRGNEIAFVPQSVFEITTPCLSANPIAQMKKCYQEPSEQLRKSLSKRNFINIYKEDLE